MYNDSKFLSVIQSVAVADCLFTKDMFFAFPWNNFLHSAVYDVVHQVMTGAVDAGHNRELIVSLFRDAKILSRIVEGQNLNDRES